MTLPNDKNKYKLGDFDEHLKERMKDPGFRAAWFEDEAKRLRAALEKIRSTNGLQYSDIFRICDEALTLSQPKEEL